MRVHATLTQNPIDIRKIEDAHYQTSDISGAVVTFSGVVRPTTKRGEALGRLVLEWHPRMTELSLQNIAEKGYERFGVDHITVIHRCGPISPGDPIVFVGVKSSHRREAFQAADYVMDRLKTDAIFWKREEGSFGTRWIEPTDRDQNDRLRWRTS